VAQARGLQFHRGGLAVGALAKLFMPGRDPGGILVAILLGIAGAVVAGWIGSTIGWYDIDDAGPGLIASVLGAMLLLWLYRMFVGRRAKGT